MVIKIINQRKKINKVESLTQAMKTSNDIKCVGIDEDEDDWDNEVTDFQTFDIEQTALVQYFKKGWKYYVDFIENISQNPRQHHKVLQIDRQRKWRKVC